MKKLIFYGCPAGLGNRYEELFRLSSFATNYDIEINYFWNNSTNIKYRNLFTAQNLKIEEISNLKNWPTKNFESSRYWREFISSQIITKSENIKLRIENKNEILDYVALHIRGTDRIVEGNQIPPGFQSKEESEMTIFYAKQYLKNTKNSLPIAIFSEDNNLKKRVQNELGTFDIISLPPIDSIEKDYEDLFYLSQAKSIIMCSKYSTFALTASSLGKNKLVTFFDNNNSEMKLWNLNIYSYKENYENIFNKSNNLENEINLTSLGNKRIKSFYVDNYIINKTKYLVSFNESNYLGFEEHFKLVNSSIILKMYKSSILKIKIIKLFEIIKFEKNRKLLIQKLLKECIQLFKCLNLLPFILKSKNSNLKKYYFVYCDYSDFWEAYPKFFNNKNFIGAIICLDNKIKNKQGLLEIKNSLNKNYHCSEFIKEFDNQYLKIVKIK